MSVTKRELDLESPDTITKRRKTENQVPEESRGEEAVAYSRKNLLKSGSTPTGKAYQRKKIVLELCLPPIDASDPLAGVERQLDDVLLTYVKEAEGILMGWDAPRFLDKSARVLDESPFCHARVVVDTIVWRPRRDEELEGQVKLMGPSHIGLLILGTFNASIPLRLIPENWTFEENFEGDDGYWRDGNGTALAIDQTLRFKTVNIKKGANILSVEGSLLEQVFQPKYEDGGTTDSSKTLVQGVGSQNTSTDMAQGSNEKRASKADRKLEKERRRAEKKLAKARKV